MHKRRQINIIRTRHWVTQHKIPHGLKVQPREIIGRADLGGRGLARPVSRRAAHRHVCVPPMAASSVAPRPAGRLFEPKPLEQEGVAGTGPVGAGASTAEAVHGFADHAPELRELRAGYDTE